MDNARFESSEFGTLVAEPEGRWEYFEPKPIPRDLSLDPQTVMALSRADEAVGGLAAISELVKNPDLLWRPYAYREALASARIEGTQADPQSVLKADRKPGGSGVPEMDIVIQSVFALEAGLTEIGDKRAPTFDCLSDLHQILLGPFEEVAGRRTMPVWLGSPMDRPETAVFIPPIGPAVDAALRDWDSYLLDPPPMPVLVRAALLHYQFLTIHPFRDGNGRVGRLLILLFLAYEERLKYPMLYLSSYFEKERRQYFDRLQAVRERAEIQQWVQFFLTAVEREASDGIRRAKYLIELRERYRRELGTGGGKSLAVMEIMFENPILTTAVIKEKTGLSTQGALNVLRSFEKRDWLTQLPNAGRGGATWWMAPEIFRGVWDEF